MRLNQFLAKAGVASRRKADLLIEAGKVRVNGKKVETLGYIIDEKIDKVEVDGREAKIGQNLIYILLNKPKGYLSTAI
ncbi:MAG: pseudouridine synthase, partial [candidate division Zixibacteria bacterium]|nr:pseudouridine synthase [candidate division Zixibacteria bacterium]